MSTPPTPLPSKVRQASDGLDAQVREVVAWHFSPETGTPFWLERATSFRFDPRKDVKSFADLKLFGHFEDDWLRGGPVRRWVPKAYADKPLYVFETGGTTGVPKSRVAVEDFRIDYSLFSDTLPERYFPLGANWLMLGPSGPRRLRLAVEHLAQHRGGICFCIDLDPRWVIKLIQKGWMEHLEAYKQHCIDQALTSGAHVGIGTLFAMRLRKVPPLRVPNGASVRLLRISPPVVSPCPACSCGIIVCFSIG